MTRILTPHRQPNPHAGSNFEEDTSSAVVRSVPDETDLAANFSALSKDSTVLSQTAFEAFVATCEKPPKPTAALRELMAWHQI